MQTRLQRAGLPSSRPAPVYRRDSSKLRALGQQGAGAKAAALAGGKAWVESMLARFGPATDRAQNITTLEFEKPLLELDKRIKEVSFGRSRQTTLGVILARPPVPQPSRVPPAGPQGR